MTTKKDILSQLKKREKPEVPNGFFKGFSDQVIDELSVKSQVLDKLEKAEKPKLDKTFFDNFGDQVMSKIGTETIPIKNKSKVKYLYWFAAAAAIILLFLAVPSNTDGELASEDVYALTQADVTLLAYLSEEDIIDYLVDLDNEELVEDEDDIFFDELESEIYNYIDEL